VSNEAEKTEPPATKLFRSMKREHPAVRRGPGVFFESTLRPRHRKCRAVSVTARGLRGTEKDSRPCYTSPTSFRVSTVGSRVSLGTRNFSSTDQSRGHVC